MSVKKTARRMIAALPVAVKKVSQSFPTIPNEESPGGPSPRPDSDSILSLPLATRDEPGLSALFPLLAVSIIDSLMVGAATPYEQLKLFSERS